MKILIIIALVFSANSMIAQDNRKFDITKTEFGNYSVKPLFNDSKGQGNQGLPVWVDNVYFNNLFYSRISGVVPKDKLEKLHRSSQFIITFNLEGETINCWFIINSNDISIINEKELYAIYKGILEIKIDMSKIKIERPIELTNNGPIGYAIISMSLVPPEYKKIAFKPVIGVRVAPFMLHYGLH